MIAQSSVIDRTRKLLVNRTTSHVDSTAADGGSDGEEQATQGPVTIFVEEVGTYRVTIFPTVEGVGLLGFDSTVVPYTAQITVMVIPPEEQATQSTIIIEGEMGFEDS